MNDFLFFLDIELCTRAPVLASCDLAVSTAFLTKASFVFPAIFEEATQQKHVRKTRFVFQSFNPSIFSFSALFVHFIKS